jgi:hypothetical protein
MATVADYITFADSPVTLAEAVGNVDFPINLPANFNSDKAGILTFMLYVGNGNGLKLVFWIIDAPPGSGSAKIGEINPWSGNYFGTVQELLGGSPLANGKILRFARMAGTGTMKISDVTLWFQVNV